MHKILFVIFLQFPLFYLISSRWDNFCILCPPPVPQIPIFLPSPLSAHNFFTIFHFLTVFTIFTILRWNFLLSIYSRYIMSGWYNHIHMTLAHKTGEGAKWNASLKPKLWEAGKYQSLAHVSKICVNDDDHDFGGCW